MHGTVVDYLEGEDHDEVILKPPGKRSTTVPVPKGWWKQEQLEFDL